MISKPGRRNRRDTHSEKCLANIERIMTRPTIILTLVIALAGQLAVQAAADVVIGPAVNEVAAEVRVAVIDGYEYTAEQVEALQRFLNSEPAP